LHRFGAKGSDKAHHGGMIVGRLGNLGHRPDAFVGMLEKLVA